MLSSSMSVAMEAVQPRIDGLVSALRRAILKHGLSEQRAMKALSAYNELPMTRHGHREFLPRLFELRHNFTAYDATYVALAEALSAELLTEDRKLAKAARKFVALV